MSKKQNIEDLLFDDDEEVTMNVPDKRVRGRPKKDVMPVKEKSRLEVAEEMERDIQREEAKHAKRTAEVGEMETEVRKNSNVSNLEDTYRDKIEKLEKLMNENNSSSSTRIETLVKKIEELEVKLEKARLQEKDNYNAQLANVKRGIRY